MSKCIVDRLVAVWDIGINPFLRQMRPVRASKRLVQHRHRIAGDIQARCEEGAFAGKLIQVPVDESEIEADGVR